jgi:hypothetical protein
MGVVNNKMPTTWQDLVNVRLEVALTGHSGVLDSEAPVEPKMSWTVGAGGRGVFSASGPGARVYVGRPGGAGGLAAGGIELAKPDFAAVTVTALDGRPLAKSRSVLIAACGRCENTGMQFSADRRTVGRNWGKAPVLIEPVEGRVALPPGDWKVRALAPDGTPGAEAKVARDAEGRAVLELSPAMKTMWYLATQADSK